MFIFTKWVVVRESKIPGFVSRTFPRRQTFLLTLHPRTPLSLLSPTSSRRVSSRRRLGHRGGRRDTGTSHTYARVQLRRGTPSARRGRHVPSLRQTRLVTGQRYLCSSSSTHRPLPPPSPSPSPLLRRHLPRPRTSRPRRRKDSLATSLGISCLGGRAVVRGRGGRWCLLFLLSVGEVGTGPGRPRHSRMNGGRTTGVPGSIRKATDLLRHTSHPLPRRDGRMVAVDYPRFVRSTSPARSLVRPLAPHPASVVGLSRTVLAVLELGGVVPLTGTTERRRHGEQRW